MISGLRFAMTFACVLITVESIYHLIENFERRDTVWKISEMKTTKMLTPLVILCSEPHNFDPKSDLVYRTKFAKTLQIKQLKTSMKVCKGFFKCFFIFFLFNRAPAIIFQVNGFSGIQWNMIVKKVCATMQKADSDCISCYREKKSSFRPIILSKVQNLW